MKIIQIITLLFFSVCFSQNIESENFYSELGKAEANGYSNSKDEVQSEGADSIRNAYKKQKLPDLPEDFNPDNGLAFGVEVGGSEKLSFHEKNNNIDEATNMPQAENSANESNNSNYNRETKKLSLSDKFIRIVCLVIGWFVAGFLINFFFYAGKPDYLVGKSESAKFVHIITNIITIILFIVILF